MMCVTVSCTVSCTLNQLHLPGSDFGCPRSAVDAIKKYVDWRNGSGLMVSQEVSVRVMGAIEIGNIESIRHGAGGTKLNIRMANSRKLLSRFARVVVPKGNFVGSEATVTKFESSCEKEEATVTKFVKCGYCDCLDKDALVKCCKCDKIFCNGKGKMHNSHIVEHLVLSRHKVVAINETKKLKCFSCDTTNIFELGFVQAEDTVVILCRLPCSVKSDILDLANFSEWRPVILGQMFQPCLVASPNVPVITINEIRRLENDWAAVGFEGAESVVVVDPDAVVLLR
jgi:hypothetical protein